MKDVYPGVTGGKVVYSRTDWSAQPLPSVQLVAVVGTTYILATCETAQIQGKRDQLEEKGRARCHHRAPEFIP